MFYQVSPTSNNAVLRKIMEKEIDEQNRERKEEFLWYFQPIHLNKYILNFHRIAALSH